MLSTRGAAARAVRILARRAQRRARWASEKPAAEGAAPKQERSAGSGGSTDLKLDRELPTDSSQMIPFRFLTAFFGFMVALSVYVFMGRYWYTRSIISPMRKKYSEEENKAHAWRDYDDRIVQLNKDKVFEDGLKPFVVPFPFTNTNWRKIPPPDKENPCTEREF